MLWRQELRKCEEEERPCWGALFESRVSPGSCNLGRRQPGCVLGRCSLYLLGSWRKHPHNSLIISLFRIFPYCRRPLSWFVWISAINWQTFMHTHELWELKWAELFWTMAYINPTPRLKEYLYVQSQWRHVKPHGFCFFPWDSSRRHRHFPDSYPDDYYNLLHIIILR